MKPRHPIIPVAVLLFAATGLAWLGTVAKPGAIPTKQIAVDQVYAIDVAFDRSWLDLPFDRDSRYLLIVGSLSDDHNRHQVTLTAEQIDEPQGIPARMLPALDRPSTAWVVAKVQFRPEGKQQRGGERGALPGRPRETGLSPATRDFYLHVTDGPLDDRRHYARVTGRLVGEGRLVRVFLDRQQRPDELAAGLIEETIHLLDAELIPSLRRQVGECRDVDGDKKFTVLFSPWLGRLQGGKISLGGFVRESDFRHDREPPFSNRSDMIYLNTNLVPGRHLQTLLAHELMHAVCFSARLPSATRPAGLPEEEDWLNEAIAHLSENMNGGGWSNLDYRISRFLNGPQRYPLVVTDYYNTGLWRNHGCRGATYLFLRWCVDQFGDQMLGDLIRAPSQGRGNLEQTTGLPFEELFRRWTVALYQSGRHAATDDHQRKQVANDPVLLSHEARPVGSGSFDERVTRTGFKTYAGWPGLRKDSSPGHPSKTGIETTSTATNVFRSLDLLAPVSNFGLAGPRTVGWDVNAGPCTVQLAGTSAAFIELHSTQTSGMRRIRVAAKFGTKLQVTLLKLPADLQQINVQASWVATTSAETSVDEPMAKVQVDVAGAAALDVEHITCERNVGNVKKSFCFAGGQLDDSRAPLRPEAVTRYSLRLRSVEPSSAGWTVKVVARDARGRRIVAWADVSPPIPRSGKRLRLAKTTDRRGNGSR